MFDDGMIDNCQLIEVTKVIDEYNVPSVIYTRKVSSYKCRFTIVPARVAIEITTSLGADLNDIRFVMSRSNAYAVAGNIVYDNTAYWKIIKTEDRRGIRSTSAHHIRLLVRRTTEVKTVV